MVWLEICVYSIDPHANLRKQDISTECFPCLLTCLIPLIWGQHESWNNHCVGYGMQRSGGWVLPSQAAPAQGKGAGWGQITQKCECPAGDKEGPRLGNGGVEANGKAGK